MGDGKSYGFHHLGVLQEHFFNFPWGNFLSATIYDFLAATDEKQVPIVIEKTTVPRLEPVTRKGGTGRCWVSVVTRHDAGATDDDLPRLTAGQQGSIVVHNRDIQIDRQADRARFTTTRRQRVARDRRSSGFRYPAKLEHGSLESPFQFCRDGR